MAQYEKFIRITLYPLQMAQYANPQQFGAPMGEDGQYMQQVRIWYRQKETAFPRRLICILLITTNRTKNQSVPSQDEEWEREGLLDPAWEKQQRKV